MSESDHVYVIVTPSLAIVHARVGYNTGKDAPFFYLLSLTDNYPY